MDDRVYAQKQAVVAPFRFDARVAAAFDDMAHRSIPGYEECLNLCVRIVAEEAITGDIVVDLGTSTGALPSRIRDEIRDRELRIIGVDASPEMLEIAARRCGERVELVEARLEDWEPPAARITVLNYLLQFVPAQHRLRILTAIADTAPRPSVIILSEKLAPSNAAEAARWQASYDAFKRGNGYSDLEIEQKRAALDGVLVPLTLSENIALLHEAGYEEVYVAARSLQFATIVGRR